MSIMPKLPGEAQQIEQVTAFAGYVHKPAISDGEFFDMRNMTADGYPIAATRDKRCEMVFNHNGAPLNTVVGICGKEKILAAFTQDAGIGVSIGDTGLDGTAEEPDIQDDKDDFPGTRVPYTIVPGAEGLLKALDPSGTTDIAKNLYWVPDSPVGETPVPIPIAKIDNEGFWIKWQENQTDYEYGSGKIIIGITYNEESEYSFISDTVGEGIRVSKGCIDNSLVRAALPGRTMYVGYAGDDILNGPYIVSLVRKDNVSAGKYHILFRDIEHRIDNLFFFDPQDPKRVRYVGLLMYAVLGTVAGIDVSTPGLNEDPIETNLSIYDKVKLNVEEGRESAFPSLIGREFTLNYVEDYEEKTGNFVISTIRNEGGTYYAYIPKPHPPVPAGYTVSGNMLYLGEYNPETEEIKSATQICLADTTQEHQLIEMGAYVIIFPEKYKVNTVLKNKVTGTYSDIKPLEYSAAAGAQFKYRLCDINGTFPANVTESLTVPASPTNGKYWLDTSKPDKPVLKQYSSQTRTWAVIPMYCRLWSAAVLDSFNEDDAIQIDGGLPPHIIPAEKQQYYVITKSGRCDSDGTDNSAGDYSFVMFQIAMDTAAEQTGIESITLKRTVPKTDFVIECNNRLWGCRYGENENGETVNEIFASKLGDPGNWHYFANTSIDSYFMSMGDDGYFTGAAAYQSNPVFFRQDLVHRIYGTYPSNYQLKTINGYGVAPGSHNSIAIMNDVLYYQASVGFMAYTGGVPVNISDDLGRDRYSEAVSGTVGHKLYISSKCGNGHSLLVFNDYYKEWHKEDEIDIAHFITYGDEVFGLTSDGRMLAMQGLAGKRREDDFEWFIETGKIGFASPFRKRMSKLTLRVKMDLNTVASVSIEYDSSGDREYVNMLRPTGRAGAIAIAVVPHRCDHFAVRIEGKGSFRLLGAAKYYEEGSDYD